MTKRKGQNRKSPNMTEKLASALLHIRRGVNGDDWLISGDLRKASAKEICAVIDFDHIRRWAEDGTNEPQNLQPLLRDEHREKSNKDNTEIAKGKRFGEAHTEFQRRLLAKAGQEVDDPAPPKLKKAWPTGRKMQSSGFPSREERLAMKEKSRSG